MPQPTSRTGQGRSPEKISARSYASGAIPYTRTASGARTTAGVGSAGARSAPLPGATIRRGAPSRQTPPSRRRRRSFLSGRLILLVAVALVLLAGMVGGGIWLWRKLQSRSASSVSSLSSGEARTVAPLGNNLLCLSDQSLWCVDGGDATKWLVPLTARYELCVSPDGSLVGLYESGAFQVLNAEGVRLFQQEFPLGVEQMRAGSSMIALLSTDEDVTPCIQIYRSDGSAVETIRFANRQVLDYGFYGSDQLWVLLLDTNSDVPISRISTYNPGVSLTGMVTITDQLVYKLLFNSQKEVFAIGTESILCFNTAGSLREEIPISGWVFEDALTIESDLHILLSPATDEIVGVLAQVDRTQVSDGLPGASPDATAGPDATASPDTTTDPNATASPDTTTDSNATTDPDATANPDATAAPDTSFVPSASPAATAVPTMAPITPSTPAPTLAPVGPGEGFPCVRMLILTRQTAKNNSQETSFTVKDQILTLPATMKQVFMVDAETILLRGEGELWSWRKGEARSLLVFPADRDCLATQGHKVFFLPQTGAVYRVRVGK